ncbi:hypothetical protein ACA910_021499 [Epithemia clementina (nom. ined.)]
MTVASRNSSSTSQTLTNTATISPPSTMDSLVLAGNSNSKKTTKENDGGRSRQRCIRRWLLRIVLCTSVFVLSYHFMWTYWLAGVFVPDYEIDEEGHKRFRRHPDQLFKIDKATYSKIPTNYMDAILEGYLTLIDLSIPQTTGLIPNPNATTADSYQGIKATFCHIAWDLQERDATQVPLFRDLQKQSPLCVDTTVRNLDFWTLVQQARAYDLGQHNFTATTPKPGHQVVAQPTAVLFHETRCGSTLVSNLVASSLPPQVRSFSESTPPLVALMACDILSSSSSSIPNGPSPCFKESQLQLIRDVFYMMGRLTRPQRPQYVFYKIQSIGARYIHLLSEALPNVPWAFVFRDSVEILMSHFKDYQWTAQKHEKYNKISKPSSSSSFFSWNNKNSHYGHIHDGHDTNQGRPVCLRSYGKPRQDPILLDVVHSRAPGRNVSSLTAEEYCAAHLASLAQSAVAEYQSMHGTDLTKPHVLSHKLSKHWFLNYAKFPHVIWEEWLPVVLHQRMNDDMVNRMQNAANVDAKGNNNNNDNNNNGEGKSQLWHEDSTLKQARAPESLKKAAKLFLDPVYQIMTDIEETQHT